MTHQNSKINFIFFGTSKFSVDVLEVLKANGYVPNLIVTKPDSPQGRGLEIQPPPIKIWAEVHNIETYQPETLKDADVVKKLKQQEADVFIVAAYGMLIPSNVFNIPQHKTLNIHPSLLPKLRGPSPIQNTILLNEKPGVTIMLISEGMDEGDIIAQDSINLPESIPQKSILEDLLAKLGGEMLVKVLPDWVEGKMKTTPQDESEVTYCKKIEKKDGFIDLADDPQINIRKVKALADKPGTYLIFKKKNGKEVRVSVKDAEIVDNKFTPTRVIPEGKKEMNWEDFLRGNL